MDRNTRGIQQFQVLDRRRSRAQLSGTCDNVGGSTINSVKERGRVNPQVAITYPSPSMRRGSKGALRSPGTWTKSLRPQLSTLNDQLPTLSYLLRPLLANGFGVFPRLGDEDRSVVWLSVVARCHLCLVSCQ